MFVIDADNTIYPRAIARLHEALTNLPVGVAYTQLKFFGDQWDREGFARGNYADVMALVSKDAWQRMGGYTHLEGGWEDFNFWCNLIDAGIESIFMPKMLCRYRVHDSSMLRTETNQAHDRRQIELAAAPLAALQLDRVNRSCRVQVGVIYSPVTVRTAAPQASAAASSAPGVNADRVSVAPRVPRHGQWLASVPAPA